MENYYSNELCTKFRRRLGAWQRQLLLREAGRLLPEAVLLGAATAVTLTFAIPVAWISALGVAVAVALLIPVAFAFGRYGSHAHCAREFDRRMESNTRVLNAYEVLKHHNETAFALFAIADGCAALETKYRQSTRFRDRRVHLRRTICAGVLLAAGIIAVLAGRGTEQFAAAPTEGGIILRPDGQESNRLKTASSRREQLEQQFHTPGEAVGSIEREPISEIPIDDEERRRNQFSYSTNTNTPVTDKTGKTGTVPQEEQSIPGEESSGENGKSDHASSAATATEPVPTSALSAVEKSAGSNERSRRSNRKRPKRRNPESALGNSLPMLADNAPPAGRELGEKEGDGEPDNGRGGPTGEKKARGSAAMLPVEPQPDTVDGTLAPGEEIRLAEHLPPPERTPVRSSSVATVATGAVEPVAASEIMNLTTRKEIIRLRKIEP